MGLRPLLTTMTHFDISSAAASVAESRSLRRNQSGYKSWWSAEPESGRETHDAQAFKKNAEFLQTPKPKRQPSVTFYWVPRRYPIPV